MPLPAPALGICGLALVVLRLGLLRLTGPDNPSWVDQTLRLEWWVLQPALWAASAKQAIDLRARAAELQQREAEAQAAARRAGRRAAVGASVGAVGASVGALGIAAATAAVRAAGAAASEERWPAERELALAPLIGCQVSAAPAPPSRARAGGAQRAGAFAGGAVCASLALAAAGAARRRPKFRDHVHRERLPHCVRRTVTVQCPGVLRAGAVVNVLPHSNGAEVSLTRSAAKGLPAVAWRKTYSFPWREGSYECLQEALTLENGVLTLVFEADVQRERIIRVPHPAPALAFSMAGGDIPTPPDREPCESPDPEGSNILTGCSECTEEPSPSVKMSEAASAGGSVQDAVVDAAA